MILIKRLIKLLSNTLNFMYLRWKEKGKGFFFKYNLMEEETMEIYNGLNYCRCQI